MTQRGLADRLHVSDRAVSKWERGAGFPDVSLLEDLAEALDLTVLDLLRGQRGEKTDVESAVQEALTAFQLERKRQRREDGLLAGKLLGFLAALALAWLWLFPIRTAVDHTVVAGVYQNGALAAYTEVEIQGETERYMLSGRRGYWGRFAIGCMEWTCRERMNAQISLNGEDGLIYILSGIIRAELHDLNTVMSQDVREFALALERSDSAGEGDWVILATSPESYEAYRQKAYSYTGGGASVPPLQTPEPEWRPARSDKSPGL